MLRSYYAVKFSSSSSVDFSRLLGNSFALQHCLRLPIWFLTFWLRDNNLGHQRTTFSIFSPDSIAPLTFSYSRLYEYPTHAVLQSFGLSRTLGTLENGLFRLPSSPDFLPLGFFGLEDLKDFCPSFYSFRIRHIWIRYIWYINFSGVPTFRERPEDWRTACVGYSYRRE